MKKLLINLFVITTTIFVGLYLLELNKTAKNQSLINKLEQKLKDATEKNSKIKSVITKQKKAEADYETEVINLERSKVQLVEQIELRNKEKTESLAMQELTRLHFKNSFELKYNSLIKEFELNEMDTESFLNLLTDELMIGIKSAKGSFNSNENQRNEFGKQIHKERNEVNSMIEELLGKDKYKEYINYRKKEQERKACINFNKQLSVPNTKLSDNQKKRLINIMYEEREKSKKSADFFNFNKENVGKYDEIAVQKSIRLEKTINKKILERTKKLLTDNQYKDFELFIFKLQAQQENQFKIESEISRKLKK